MANILSHLPKPPLSIRRIGIVSLVLASLAGLLTGHASPSVHGSKLLLSQRARAAGPETAILAGPEGLQAATSSAVVESSFYSPSVGKTLPYLVYLPAGYSTNPDARFSVLYMLHGLGGSYKEWYGDKLLETADNLIATGEIQPLIIVLPQGEDAYWVDHANGGPRWGAYVATDLVAEIDGHYRTLSDRAHRGIGGMSMGGNGALQLAMNNPDVFGVVGAHSFALRRRDQAPAYFGDQTYFNAHDPVYLFQTRPDVARSLTLWLDVGNNDSWTPADEAFDRQLSDEGIAHAWHEFSGAHEDAYWSAHTSDYLRFYGRALNH